MEHKFAIDGEFGKWLEQIGIESSFARKSMQTSKELSSNSSHVNNLGIIALYLITTLPETERTKEYITSKGAKLVKT